MRDRGTGSLDFAEDVDRREIARVALGHVGQAFGVFVVGLKRARADARWPLERDPELTFAGPFSLQIGIAPCSALDPLAARRVLRPRALCKPGDTCRDDQRV